MLFRSVLTAALERRELLKAVKRGARGVIRKDSATRDVIEGVRGVMAGRLMLDPELVGESTPEEPVAAGERRMYGLTPREQEIVDAVAAGDSNRDIALRLGISLHTVKHHLSSIFTKTGMSSRLELAVLALEARLAPNR